MTTTEKILTSAILYCISNRQLYYGKNADERYMILMSIQDELETLVGKTFTNRDECLELIKKIGQNALFGGALKNPRKIKAIERLAERQKFLIFIDSISEKELSSVEPLPYKRRLLINEENEIRVQLLKHWSIDIDFSPYKPENNAIPIIFFNKSKLTYEDFEKIEKIIHSCAKDRIYALSYSAIHEIERSIFLADVSDVLYTDMSYAWIIYSEIFGITFGGKVLISEIMKHFGDRKELINQR